MGKKKVDLYDDELKESFRKNLEEVERLLSQPCAEVVFKFFGKSQVGSESKGFTSSFVLHIVFNEYEINGFRLGGCKDEFVKKQILNNMHYNAFSYCGCDYTKGETKCQGFGDYWGEDKFVFNYVRFDD